MFNFYEGLNSTANSWSQIELMYTNMDNFTTPGFKSGNMSFEELMTDGAGYGAFHQANSTSFTQGKVKKTSGAYDLAIQDSEVGNPCTTFFVLSDGKRTRFTRAGHFGLNEGKLVETFSHMQVQGYRLDASGNKKKDKLEDISLPFDPNTKLYGGKYSGIKLGDGGKLYGEVKISDPLTKQVVSRTVPIYQVALASFADPTSLSQVSSTTYEAREGANRPNFGVAGEGTMMAQINHGSLEMSNVDLPKMAQSIIMARMAYEGQMAAFKSLTKMTETATNLVR